MDLLVRWMVATTDSWTVQLPKSRLGVLNSMSEEVTWAYTVRETGWVCTCVYVCVSWYGHETLRLVV